MRKCKLVSCFNLALLLCVTGCSEAEFDAPEIKEFFEETESELLQVAEESPELEAEIVIDEVSVYTPEPSAEFFADWGTLPTEDEIPQPNVDPTIASTSVPTPQTTPESTPVQTPEPSPTPAPTPEPIIGYIDARSLNMREGPTIDSDVVKEYEGGQHIEIVGEDGDWYKVAIGSNMGYMLKEYIVTNESPGTPKPTSTPKPKESSYKEKDGYVDARSLNLRAEPTTDADIVKEFSKGQTLKIVGETDGWYKVVIGGVTGYMTKDYVSLGAPPKPTEAPTRGNSGRNENSSAMVWIPTNGGKKYHSKSSCSNMIDPDYVTLNEAIDLGFTACKRCH